jgi:hypothetical protein
MPEVSYSLDPAGLQVIDVLLVEDDPEDVLMTTEAFELSPRHSTLHVVGDGEQAMRFLRRTRPTAPHSRLWRNSRNVAIIGSPSALPETDARC